MEALQIIEEIRETKGTKAKEQILKDNLSDPVLQQLFRWAYDWTKTIGITVTLNRKWDSAPSSKGFEDLQIIVEQLQKRELTGNAARDAIESCLSHWEPGERSFIIDFLNKKPRLGIGETVLNKIAPGLVPKFNGCMLAHKWDGKPIKFPVRVDPKIDGMRCLIIIQNGEGRAYTREGNSLPQVQFICDQIAALGHNGRVFDGELFADTWGKTLTLTKTEHDIDRRELMFYCFDSISIDEWNSGKSTQKQYTRLVDIDAPNVKMVQGISIGSQEDLMRYYDKCLEQGFEGVMIKDPYAGYECKRSKAWMKLKPEETIDYPVVGLFEGVGRLRGTLGGITLKKPNGDELGVGSGFTDAMRTELWNRGEELIGKMCEVKYQPGREGAAEFAVFSKIRDDM